MSLSGSWIEAVPSDRLDRRPPGQGELTRRQERSGTVSTPILSSPSTCVKDDHAAGLVTVACPRCGITAGILPGSIAWHSRCQGVRMVAVDPASATQMRDLARKRRYMQGYMRRRRAASRGSASVLTFGPKTRPEGASSGGFDGRTGPDTSPGLEAEGFPGRVGYYPQCLESIVGACAVPTSTVTSYNRGAHLPRAERGICSSAGRPATSPSTV